MLGKFLAAWLFTGLALALPAARKALLFKDELLRDPWMGDARRHQLVDRLYATEAPGLAAAPRRQTAAGDAG